MIKPPEQPFKPLQAAEKFFRENSHKVGEFVENRKIDASRSILYALGIYRIASDELGNKIRALNPKRQSDIDAITQEVATAQDRAEAETIAYEVQHAEVKMDEESFRDIKTIQYIDGATPEEDRVEITSGEPPQKREYKPDDAIHAIGEGRNRVLVDAKAAAHIYSNHIAPDARPGSKFPEGSTVASTVDLIASKFDLTEITLAWGKAVGPFRDHRYIGTKDVGIPMQTGVVPIADILDGVGMTNVEQIAYQKDWGWAQAQIKEANLRGDEGMKQSIMKEFNDKGYPIYVDQRRAGAPLTFFVDGNRLNPPTDGIPTTKMFIVVENGKLLTTGSGYHREALPKPVPAVEELPAKLPKELYEELQKIHATDQAIHAALMKQFETDSLDWSYAAFIKRREPPVDYEKYHQPVKRDKLEKVSKPPSAAPEIQLTLPNIAQSPKAEMAIRQELTQLASATLEAYQMVRPNREDQLRRHLADRARRYLHLPPNSIPDVSQPLAAIRSEIAQFRQDLQTRRLSVRSDRADRERLGETDTQLQCLEAESGNLEPGVIQNITLDQVEIVPHLQDARDFNDIKTMRARIREAKPNGSTETWWLSLDKGISTELAGGIAGSVVVARNQQTPGFAIVDTLPALVTKAGSESLNAYLRSLGYRYEDLWTISLGSAELINEPTVTGTPPRQEQVLSTVDTTLIEPGQIAQTADGTLASLLQANVLMGVRPLENHELLVEIQGKEPYSIPEKMTQLLTKDNYQELFQMYDTLTHIGLTPGQMREFLGDVSRRYTPKTEQRHRETNIPTHDRHVIGDKPGQFNLQIDSDITIASAPTLKGGAQISISNNALANFLDNQDALDSGETSAKEPTLTQDEYEELKGDYGEQRIDFVSIKLNPSPVINAHDGADYVKAVATMIDIGATPIEIKQLLDSRSFSTRYKTDLT